jgi:predicted nucleic acid-binding protein
LPAAPEILVVNTGPLVALGRVQAFDVIHALPIKFVTPAEVADEIAAGVRLGHTVDLPTWVEVAPVPGGVRRLNITALDEGERPSSNWRSRSA